MGQAKQRGTFDDRRQQAIVRHTEEIRKADQETRAARNHQGRPVGILPFIMLAGVGGMGSPIPGRRRR